MGGLPRDTLPPVNGSPQQPKAKAAPTAGLLEEASESAGADRLLSYRDISRLMGISEATLRNYRRRGYMPAPDVMLADRPRWSEASIARWRHLRLVAGNERRTP